MNGKHIEARLTILESDDAKDEIREKNQTLRRKRERDIASLEAFLISHKIARDEFKKS